MGFGFDSKYRSIAIRNQWNIIKYGKKNKYKRSSILAHIWISREEILFLTLVFIHNLKNWYNRRQKCIIQIVKEIFKKWNFLWRFMRIKRNIFISLICIFKDAFTFILWLLYLKNSSSDRYTASFLQMNFELNVTYRWIRPFYNLLRPRVCSYL